MFLYFLFVMLLNGKDCERHFATNEFEYSNGFGTIGRGKVCSCASAFNFVSTLAPPQNVEVERNTVKLEGFCHL